MSTPSERAQGLLDDLLNIEVDVIVADDLERGPMPVVSGDDHDAVMRSVLDGYVEWLDTHGPALDEASSSLSASIPNAPEQRPADLVEGLEWVEERAAIGEVQATRLMDVDQLPDPAWPPMLHRIRGNAAQLRAVAEGEVTEQVDRVRIVRKAWELGTHTIVAQTVVQLDGDIVARVDEDSFLTDERAPLRALHAEALRGALDNWRTLFGLVIQLVMTAGQVVRALWPPRTGLAVLKQRWRDRRQRDDATGDHEMTVRDLLRRATWTKIRADWTDFRETAVALLVDGGTTIESPADGPVFARTVIQPDGDALWFVSEEAADDQALLEAHTSRVAGWCERSGAAVATMRQIVAAFQRAVATLLAVVWTGVTAASGFAWGWWALAAGVVAAIIGGGVLLAFRAGLGHWVRKAVGLARR